jgi:Fe-S-cluster containining protein
LEQSPGVLELNYEYACRMRLPQEDRKLVQIMDRAFADAAGRAGKRLACRPGCTQCCEGTFAINALDAARLQTAIKGMRAVAPELAESLHQRGLAWIRNYGSEFPGDLTTGKIGTSEEDKARFEGFANEAPCPALNPETGLCDVYEWRPMTCRVFGPPVQVEGGGLGCCELCFGGADDQEIAACEMQVPHELEARLVAEMGRTEQTVVAFALCSAV